jgi:hypothetical protein
MSAYKVQEDGSLIFETPILFQSSNYAPDPNNPCRYIPKYDECKHRRMELTILKCGKNMVDWNCTLKHIGVNVSICRACEVPPHEK